MNDSPEAFVDWFRSSAPYIHAHRGSTFVVVIGGEVVRSKGLRDFVHDVALLSALGIRLVLVVGARPQIDARLAARGVEPRYEGGLRITDEVALECVKEAAGTLRVELEALLSMGLPNSPMAGARVRVAAGNFVMARPVGIIDGVDYGHTGKVRRVDTDALKSQLDGGGIVLLTPIGYSLTGEAFNVSTHDVAAEVAIALRAEKLVCLVEGKGVVDGKGELVCELSPDAASAIVDSKRRLARDVRLHLASAVQACRNGVRRAHLVSRKTEGGLLRELFTRDGVGTLVTAEAFEGVRRGRNGDVGGLMELLAPLESAGVLVRRSREMLERDIERFTVIERDGMIVACAATYLYPDEGAAELACVAVHPRYQDAGRADVLLAYLERSCRDAGIERLFVLTTQTAHWFQERGFEPAGKRALPSAKRRKVDGSRRSKVLVKTL